MPIPKKPGELREMMRELIHFNLHSNGYSLTADELDGCADAALRALNKYIVRPGVIEAMADRMNALLLANRSGVCDLSSEDIVQEMLAAAGLRR